MILTKKIKDQFSLFKVLEDLSNHIFILLPYYKALIYEKSLEVINFMDLKIVFVDNKKGIIEATDTSFWYGFVDDFIVRVETLTSGVTKIDVRSASRKGKSDFGVNAQRIKTFMALLKDSLG